MSMWIRAIIIDSEFSFVSPTNNITIPQECMGAILVELVSYLS